MCVCVCTSVHTPSHLTVNLLGLPPEAILFSIDWVIMCACLKLRPGSGPEGLQAVPAGPALKPVPFVASLNFSRIRVTWRADCWPLPLHFISIISGVGSGRCAFLKNSHFYTWCCGSALWEVCPLPPARCGWFGLPGLTVALPALPLIPFAGAHLPVRQGCQI